MTSIGKNMKLSVPRNLRTETHAIYAGVFGCSVRTPAPDIEIFEFGDGRNIGVFYGDAKHALTPEQHLQAIWLEFDVNDVERTTKDLLAAGAKTIDYDDKTHRYFQAPGGQVFRLATAGEK